MYAQQALNMPIGSTVMTSEDRGTPPYIGTVVYISPKVNKNHLGHEYVWVTVSRGVGQAQSERAVWPSNRLSLIS